MTPAFVQSPARSFASHLADGGRDPRRDPAVGDEIGTKFPRTHRVLVVEGVGRGRVRGAARAADLTVRKTWLRTEAPFEVAIEVWREVNASVSVFVVAGNA